MENFIFCAEFPQKFLVINIVQLKNCNGSSVFYSLNLGFLDLALFWNSKELHNKYVIFQLHKNKIDENRCHKKLRLPRIKTPQS